MNTTNTTNALERYVLINMHMNEYSESIFNNLPNKDQNSWTTHTDKCITTCDEKNKCYIIEAKGPPETTLQNTLGIKDGEKHVHHIKSNFLK